MASCTPKSLSSASSVDSCHPAERATSSAPRCAIISSRVIRRLALITSSFAERAPQRLLTCRRCLGRLLPFCHRHVRFDRVCNETILMCSVMHLIEFFCTGFSVAAPRDLRAKLNSSDRQLAVSVFLHMADCLVLVRIEHELLLTGNRQEREHVTARECSYESLLGIDIRRVPQISGGRRRRHRMPAIEAPGMIARIPLIGKLSSAALPFQSYFVFGHISYMECRQALGNHRPSLFASL